MIPRHKYNPPIDEEIKKILSPFDFDSVGLVDLTTARESYGDYQRLQEGNLKSWLGGDNEGQLGFLRRNKGLAFSPELVAPGTRSVIVCTWNYNQGLASYKSIPTNAGRVASYAHGRDYHKSFLKNLQRAARAIEKAFVGESCKAFTDSNPVHERYFAVLAGLGFIGRHTLLITSGEGSYVFIGLLYTTKTFTPKKTFSQLPVLDHGKCPSSCEKCIVACPTGAISREGFVDARLCISYLTIEYEGIIERSLAQKMGDWIFGCDLCQDVCPFILRRIDSKHEDQNTPIAGDFVLLEKILALKSHNDLVELFAGSPLMRAGRTKLIRNALIVIGNKKLTATFDLVKPLTGDPDPVISFHARETLTILLAD